MPITAQSLLLRSSVDLQDTDGTRWPVLEQLGHLNEALRTLLTLRPDLNALTAPFTPVAGATQTLPATACTFIDVPRNAAGRKRAITKVDRNLLDRQAPDWMSTPPSTEALHFMFDLREPRVFHIYPPLSVTALLELTVSPYPPEITQASTIDLPAYWDTALLHYMLHRAYSKDAEFGANAALSASHLALFSAASGAQLQPAATLAAAS
jgi:hypothetical protein